MNKFHTLTNIFCIKKNHMVYYVFSRQVGYRGGIANAGGAFGGKAYGPVQVTNVNCTGEEGGLLACGHQEPSPQHCGHEQDAGVTCHLGVTSVLIANSTCTL